MKLDVVIYSKTTAIGLFWFANWYDSPTIMFIYEAHNYAGNNSDKWENASLEKIKAFAEKSIYNENLVLKIKDSLIVCDYISADLFKSVAKIFADVYTVNFFENRKIIYTDLIKCCQVEGAWLIIENLKDSENEEDKHEAFMCLKILAEELNIGIAYHQLAYFYQEGIGVDKNDEKVLPLMKKAAELGDKEAKEWINRSSSKKS
ncbi:MAG: SEL1-like repeat protein [Treponema sp.]|nr:SEL1-like repeat protein [Treponema sp.]